MVHFSENVFFWNSQVSWWSCIVCTVFRFSFSFRLFLGPVFNEKVTKRRPQEKSKRKQKSKNCKHNTWPSRYLWIPEKNIFGKVYHFGEILLQKSWKIMIFPSCVIKNRDQKKSQNSGMTFLVFLNIFFTISMYQLKKNSAGTYTLMDKWLETRSCPRHYRIL